MAYSNFTIRHRYFEYNFFQFKKYLKGVSSFFKFLKNHMHTHLQKETQLQIKRSKVLG